MRASAIAQYTSVQAAATSSVTASPSTSAMAANRWLWTSGYWSRVMPSDACLCAMRLSSASGVVAGCATRAEANAAMEPASACRWVPLAWLPRLNRFRSRSGWAVKSLV